MHDLLQRAQGALWHFLLMLAMFGGVGYIVWDAQVDTVPALLIPSMWFLYCCMLFFPSSRLALAVVYYFDAFDTSEIKALILVPTALLLSHSLYQWSPVGILHMVVFGIMNRCFIQRGKQRELLEVAAAYLAAYRAATIAATRGLEDAPQPDSAAAEPGQFDDSDGPHALVYFLDGPTVEEVVEPKPRARSSNNILWSILSVLLKLGVAVLVAHALIDAFLQNWAINQAPVASAPLFEAEVVVQANKTELPIRVPIAEFIPTSTFGSPCQAAPTPTPVAKSIVTIMSTTMPTPMPAPTPTAIPEPMPEPEPMPAHDEPLKLLHSLIDFDIPDPKPLLVWYFELPPASQYTVIVISLLLAWCLSKPLIALAVLLLSLASAYLAAAAVLPLLSIYGFTPKQSLHIVLPAALVLIGGILRAIFWLKNLASTSWKNTAGLAHIKSDLENLHVQSELGLEDTRKSISAVFTILRGLLRCVARIKTMASEQGESIKKLNSLIKSLVMDKANKVDLDGIANTLKELSEKIGEFEGSKANDSLLREVQNNLGSLSSSIDGLQAKKADAEDLKKFQQELQGLRNRFDNLQKTEANDTEIANISRQFKELEDTFTGISNTQSQHVTSISTLRGQMTGARTEIKSLRTASTQNAEMIGKLDEQSKESKKAIKDVIDRAAKDKEDANKRISRLEKENARVKKENADVKQENVSVKQENSGLRQENDSLQVDMKIMDKRMNAVEKKQVTQKDLKELRENIASDVDQKVSQLRSETGSEHDQAVQEHKDLQASVDTRFAGSTQAVNDLRKEFEAGQEQLRQEQVKLSEDSEKKLFPLIGGVENSLNEHKTDVCNRFDGISGRIVAADGKTSDVLERVEAVESQRDNFIARSEVDDYIRKQIEEYMETFMVSHTFRAAVHDAQLTLKQQYQRDRLRNQVHQLTEEFLGEKEIQEKIYANFKERQALNNLPGGPPGVISGGRAGSPGVDPSNSPAAPPNTDGNDDLPGDPAEVVTGGRATLPGGMSSDNTTTPTIPEASTIPDDVDDHHGTRGVPLGEPPGELPIRHASSLGGSTSDGPSGDDGTGPLPSGGGNDDMLQPKQLGDGDSCEHDNLTGEQLSGPTDRDQPGGEQEEETDEEETDDDNDDDANGDSDDDDSDDDGPPCPPPGGGGGGSHGHNGAGGKDDDDDDGSNGGAPHPPPAPRTSRPSPSLAGSMFAPDDFQSRTPASGSARHGNGAGGNEDDHHDEDNGVASSSTPASSVSHGRISNRGGDWGARDDIGAKPKSSGKNRSKNQKLRSKTYFNNKDDHMDFRAVMNEVEKEQKEQEQGQPPPTQQTEAEKKLDGCRNKLKKTQLDLLKDLDKAEEAHKAKEAREQTGQAQEQLLPAQKQQEPTKNHRADAKRRLKEGEDLLKEMGLLLKNFDALQEQKQEQSMQQEEGQCEQEEEQSEQENEEDNDPSQAPNKNGGSRRRRPRGQGGKNKKQSTQQSNGQTSQKDGRKGGGNGGGNGGGRRPRQNAQRA